ncbi:C-reactive protein 1.1-like [Dendronephthya gigantea]|uniref:C-reactive protein 1.1-like n=1 Tax=Dendronephthya gigantea TaxID=151771 RepID=UPI00106A8301|nr:C-reactive protein 1.1-like [Dendronephthya gigantea]
MMNSGLTIVLLLSTFGLSAFSHSYSKCCPQSFFCELRNKLKAANQLCPQNKTTYVHLSHIGEKNCKSLTEELHNKQDVYRSLCGKCFTTMIFSEKNTVDYARSDGAPEMNKFTMCLWVKTKQDPTNAHYISYALEDADNQILLYVSPESKLALCIEHDSKKRTCSSGDKIAINDGNWNHICVTWQSSDGGYSFHKNGAIVARGTLSKWAEMPAIPGDGTWVFRQDQDKVGGKFDADQSATGEFTEVNIWNETLRQPKIMDMSKSFKPLKTDGNVKSWADFICGARGNVIFGND